MRRERRLPEGRDEQGFMLVGLVVAIFLILLVLGIAAPKVARDLRRDRELEAVHRGNQYVRAVRLYYKKFGHYPGSVEQLEKTNNIRFLRQKYVDPMTGKADWRLIHVGEAKTTVKGFFGQPLAGLPSAGLGSAAGLSSGIGGASTVSSPTGGTGSTLGGTSNGLGGSSSGLGGLNSGTSTVGGTGTDASGIGTGTGSSGGISSQSATSFTGTGAPIMGVGSSAPGSSIVVLNEQTTYPTWEFIYDPRIEQLYAKASLFGGGPATASGTSGLGSASGLSSGIGVNAPGATGTGTTTGTGTGTGTGSGTGSTPSTTPQ